MSLPPFIIPLPKTALFPLSYLFRHLREWLCPGFPDQVAKVIEAKPEVARTDEERLYIALGKMNEYALVRALCNHAKHFEYQKAPLDNKMGHVHGASVGLMRCGDALDVDDFTVDGLSVREVF